MKTPSPNFLYPNPCDPSQRLTVLEYDGLSSGQAAVVLLQGLKLYRLALCCSHTVLNSTSCVCQTHDATLPPRRMATYATDYRLCIIQAAHVLHLWLRTFSTTAVRMCWRMERVVFLSIRQKLQTWFNELTCLNVEPTQTQCLFSFRKLMLKWLAWLCFREYRAMLGCFSTVNIRQLDLLYTFTSNCYMAVSVFCTRLMNMTFFIRFFSPLLLMNRIHDKSQTANEVLFCSIESKILRVTDSCLFLMKACNKFKQWIE